MRALRTGDVTSAHVAGRYVAGLEPTPGERALLVDESRRRPGLELEREVGEPSTSRSS